MSSFSAVHSSPITKPHLFSSDPVTLTSRKRGREEGLSFSPLKKRCVQPLSFTTELLAFSPVNSLYKLDVEHFLCNPSSPKIDRSRVQANPQIAEKKQILIYPGGYAYKGEVKEDSPHGLGKLSHSKGALSYEGSWMNGLRHGEGKVVYADGSTYEGSWKNGLRYGEGKMVCADGSTYEGSWKNGCRHGEGKVVYSNGLTYQGSWENDSPCGRGTSRRNNHTFSGMFLNGRLNGFGKAVYADGSSYEGEWVNDLPHGQGKRTWHSGSEVGLFVNGKFYGVSKFQGKGVERLLGTPL